MTKDEALDLALEALEAIIHWYGVRDKNDVMMPPLNQNPEIKESMDAITAIKQARSAPVQEPVACVIDGDLYFHHEIDWEDLAYQGHGVELLYTTPPAAQRQWVGLTDEEIDKAMDYWSEDCRSAYGGAHAADGEYVSMISTWRYIEAKLKEKNNG